RRPCSATTSVPPGMGPRRLDDGRARPRSFVLSPPSRFANTDCVPRLLDALPRRTLRRLAFVAIVVTILFACGRVGVTVALATPSEVLVPPAKSAVGARPNGARDPEGEARGSSRVRSLRLRGLVIVLALATRAHPGGAQCPPASIQMPLVLM